MINLEQGRYYAMRAKRRCTGDLQAKYEASYTQWGDWGRDYGYGFGIRSEVTSEEREACDRAYTEASTALRSTTEAIVRAGVVPELSQGLLW